MTGQMVFEILFILGALESAHGGFSYSQRMPYLNANGLVRYQQKVHLTELANMDFSLYASPGGNSKGRIQSFIFTGCKTVTKECTYKYKYEHQPTSTLTLKVYDLNATFMDEFIRYQGVNVQDNCNEKWCVNSKFVYNRSNKQRNKRAVTCEGKSYGWLFFTTTYYTCPNALTHGELQAYTDNTIAKISKSAVIAKSAIDATQVWAEGEFNRIDAGLKKFVDSAEKNFEYYGEVFNDKINPALERLGKSLLFLSGISLANKIWIHSQSFYDNTERFLNNFNFKRKLAGEAFLCSTGDCKRLLSILGERDRDIVQLMILGYDFKESISLGKGEILIQYFKPESFYQEYINVKFTPALSLAAGCEQVPGGGYWCSKCLNQNNERRASRSKQTYVQLEKNELESCYKSSVKPSVSIATDKGCMSLSLTEDGTFSLKNSNDTCRSDYYAAPEEILADPFQGKLTVEDYNVSIYKPSNNFDPTKYMFNETRFNQSMATLDRYIDGNFDQVQPETLEFDSRRANLKSALPYYKWSIRASLIMSSVSLGIVLLRFLQLTLWPACLKPMLQAFGVISDRQSRNRYNVPPKKGNKKHHKKKNNQGRYAGNSSLAKDMGPCHEVPLGSSDPKPHNCIIMHVDKSVYGASQVKFCPWADQCKLEIGENSLKCITDDCIKLEDVPIHTYEGIECMCNNRGKVEILDMADVNPCDEENQKSTIL